MFPDSCHLYGGGIIRTQVRGGEGTVMEWESVRTRIARYFDRETSRGYAFGLLGVIVVTAFAQPLRPDSNSVTIALSYLRGARQCRDERDRSGCPDLARQLLHT